VLPAHVGTVNIVGADNENPIEVLAADVDGKQLGDDLAAAVRIARVEGIRDHERHRLVRWDARCGLVNLGARKQHELAYLVLHATVEHIEHATNRDVENQSGALVKELGAVDVG
jgi:hypothetical protein